jgi:hypothetical protein
VEVLNGNSLDMIIRDPDDKAIDVHPTNINGKGLLQSSQIYHPIKLHELSDEQLGALIRRNPQAITRAQAMPQQSTADMPLLHTQKLHNGYSVYDPQYGWVQALRWQNDPYQLQYASNYDQPRGYVQPLPYFQPPPPQLAAHKGYMVSTQQSDAANLSPAGWSLHQHPRIHTAYAQSSTHLHSLLFSESRAGTGAFRPVMENNPSINQSQSNR